MRRRPTLFLAAVEERRAEADRRSSVTSRESVSQLPRKRYGEVSFWEERYARDETYDWLCGWACLKPSVGVRGRVLHVGCGNSVMGVEMAADCEAVVNCDASAGVVARMARLFPEHSWIVADATALPFAADSFDVVVEKGTLDALACGDDKTKAAALVRECARVAKTKFVSVSFGQPETRLKYFSFCDDDQVRHVKLTPPSDDDDDETTRNKSPVYVYTVDKKKKKKKDQRRDETTGRRRRRRRLFGALRPRLWWSSSSSSSSLWSLTTIGGMVILASVLVVVVLVVWWRRRRFAKDVLGRLDMKLEPLLPGTARCNYELLREFADVADGLRWSLGAGTLLGAMRSGGLLPWEHDVDVYVDAPDAFRLLDRLDSSPEKILSFRGHVDRVGGPCCGFGYKLFHSSSDACELDVLVLADAAYAPWTHGKHRLWPPWGPLLAAFWDRLAGRSQKAAKGSRFLVIPEDVDQKALCADHARWTNNNASWNGPSLSYFHAEYFKRDEFFPLRTIPFYDLHVNVPNDAWASLHRTYGPRCHYEARIDHHGGIVVDLRDSRYAHLAQPADVRVSE